MDRPNIESRVRDVLSIVLERPIADDEYPTRASEPGWDSLKHIEVIFAIEGEFGLRFGSDEMAELDGMESIVIHLVRHGAR